MRSDWLFWCLPLVGSVSTVGVCWTRNQVVFDLLAPDYGVIREEWTQVFASFLSLRAAVSDEVRSCLFTDAPGRVVRSAMDSFFDERVGFFDSILLEDEFELFVDRVIKKKLNLEKAWLRIEASLNMSSPSRGSRIAWSPIERFITRVKRIWNYARAPFTATSFLDDDTVFCPSPTFFQDTLRIVTENTKSVRIVEHQVSTADRKIPKLASKLNNLSVCHDPFSPNCWPASCDSFLAPEPIGDHLWLQGGAILLAGSTITEDKHGFSSAQAFAFDFITHYLTRWGFIKDEKHFGADQPPLGDLARKKCFNATATTKKKVPDDATTSSRWALAGLPANFNVRFFRGDGPGAVSGPIFVLHDHFFARQVHRPDFLDAPHGLCAIINHDQGPRLVNIQPLKNIRFLDKDNIKLIENKTLVVDVPDYHASTIASITPMPAVNHLKDGSFVFRKKNDTSFIHRKEEQPTTRHKFV